MSREQTWTAQGVIDAVWLIANKDHVAIVERAYKFAAIAHKDEIRQSGEPYIMPHTSCGYLANLKMDPTTIASGFLHDIVEDTGVTLDDVQELFGDDVAMIVDGVTKLDENRSISLINNGWLKTTETTVSHTRTFRVMIVKLADRLHNMRTLQHLRPDKQRQVANAKP